MKIISVAIYDLLPSNQQNMNAVGLEAFLRSVKE